MGGGPLGLRTCLVGNYVSILPTYHKEFRVCGSTLESVAHDGMHLSCVRVEKSC
jgi:hypothetical protein